MADETTISTPTETVVDTSSTVEPTDVDTSTAEPTNDVEVAETETDSAEVVETTQEQKLYAGKYKSVEELEKGYAESQKAFNQVAELKKQIDAMNKAQADAQQKAQMEALKQAQQRGFNSVEAQEIADKVQVAELEYYANNLNQVSAQDYETVRQYLANYYQTGHKDYLNEAKKYFSSDFVEKVAIEKSNLRAKLQGEYNQKQQALFAEQEQKLAESLRGEFKDFLDSIKDNEIAQQTLKMYCDTGHIQSKEDMQVFINQLTGLQNYYKDIAIKEYEAQKAIEATKEKAVIDAGNGAENVNGDKIPTLAQINAMTQEQYEQAYAKYGDKLLLAN